MIFFFYGDDSFTATQKIKSIADKFRREVDPSGANITRFDGATVTAEDLAGSLQAMPLFVRKRLIIITDIFSSRKESLYEWLQQKITNIPDSTILVLHEAKSKKEFLKSLKGTMRTVFETLVKEKFAEELATPTGAKLTAYYKKLAETSGTRITDTALALLITEVDDDLHRANQELAKCAAFPKKDALDETDVRAILSATERENDFALIDAINARNRKAALKALEDELAIGAETAGITLRIARHISFLLNVQKAAGSRPNATAIASTIGANPYYVTHALTALRAWKKPDLISAHRQLLAADLEIKTGAGDARATLTRLLASL